MLESRIQAIVNWHSDFKQMKLYCEFEEAYRIGFVPSCEIIDQISPSRDKMNKSYQHF